MTNSETIHEVKFNFKKKEKERIYFFKAKT